jgi:hypothetical protein
MRYDMCPNVPPAGAFTYNRKTRPSATAQVDGDASPIVHTVAGKGCDMLLCIRYGYGKCRTDHRLLSWLFSSSIFCDDKAKVEGRGVKSGEEGAHEEPRGATKYIVPVTKYVGNA